MIAPLVPTPLLALSARVVFFMSSDPLHFDGLEDGGSNDGDDDDGNAAPFLPCNGVQAARKKNRRDAPMFDVYSFAVLVAEMFNGKAPYVTHASSGFANTCLPARRAA
jgi:hypothetical protein